MKDFSNLLVESLSGNDKGKWFVVLSQQEDGYVFYADGKKRKTDTPKKKKIKHIKIIAENAVKDLSKVTNGELRRTTSKVLRASNPGHSD